MSRNRDPLGVVEQFAVAEEIASLARHDLRNRFGAIRNARYFLERRIRTTELWANEARVPKFFALIEDEVVAADALLQSKLSFTDARPRTVGNIDVRQFVEFAASTARTAASFDIAPLDELLVNGDVEELALALRALLENAAEARDGARVHLEAARADERVQLVVTDDGPGITDPEAALQPMFTTKPGRIGLGLNIATRLARRNGGALSIAPWERGGRAVLELPAVQR